MVKRLSIEKVRLGFGKRGWQLLSNEYLGSQKKLDVICDEGHPTTITWNNFQRGQGCKVCAGNQRFSYNEVKKCFEDRKCELLSDSYVNSTKLLDFICSCGSVSKVRFAEFRQGCLCANCKGTRISQSLTQELPIPQMKALCEKAGCQFGLARRNGGRIWIDFVCKCGKSHSSLWTNFRKTQNCKRCGSDKISGEKCHFWKSDRDLVDLNKLLQKRCYNLVQRTLLCKGKTKECPKSDILNYSVGTLADHIKSHPLFYAEIDFHIDHIFPVSLFASRGITDMRTINALTNLRPLHCTLNLQKSDVVYEEAFDKWLQDTSRSSEWVINDTLVKSIESSYAGDNVTLMLPTFNQDKHHYYKDWLRSKNDGKDNVYIFPHEWPLRMKQILRRASTLANGKLRQIGARQCEIERISRPQLTAFCNDYHIQGSNKLSKVAFGLFYKNVLIGAISLGRHHRGLSELVLDRLCFRNGWHISGGSERLLGYCESWAKDKQYTCVTSFSDNRYSSGKVYDRLGFESVAENRPDYRYTLKTDSSIGFSKQSQKKSVVHCPAGLTESEWARKRGLIRIWDCGKVKWQKKLA